MNIQDDKNTARLDAARKEHDRLVSARSELDAQIATAKRRRLELVSAGQDSRAVTADLPDVEGRREATDELIARAAQTIATIEAEQAAIRDAAELDTARKGRETAVAKALAAREALTAHLRQSCYKTARLDAEVHQALEAARASANGLIAAEQKRKLPLSFGEGIAVDAAADAYEANVLIAIRRFVGGLHERGQLS